jgi:hypothetical protein
MLRIIEELDDVIDQVSQNKNYVNCLVCDEMNPQVDFIRKLTIQEWMLIKNLNTLSKSVGLNAPTMVTLWQMIEDYAKSKCDQNEN